jgi:AcrR family transcriptional regulator
MVIPVPRRSPNRRGEGERLREEILAAACRLVSELGGVEALTIRGVARTVGIAPASIYTQFADKSALIRGVIAHDYARLTTALREADQAVAAEDVVGRARAQVHAYCRFAVENPGHYRLMLGPPPPSAPRAETGKPEGASKGGAPREARRNLLAEVVHQLGHAFARCEQAGVPLRMPADRVGAMVFVSAHGRVALHHADPADLDPAAIYPFVDELISALLDSSQISSRTLA